MKIHVQYMSGHTLAARLTRYVIGLRRGRLYAQTPCRNLAVKSPSDTNQPVYPLPSKIAAVLRPASVEKAAPG